MGLFIQSEVGKQGISLDPTICLIHIFQQQYLSYTNVPFDVVQNEGYTV